jgi:branched-chain amino acid transport system substrate-binding protein
MVGMEFGDELYEMGNPFWFGIASKASTMGTQMADFFIKIGQESGHPPKRAVCLFQDGAMGQATHDVLVKYLPAKGVKVVADGVFPTGKVSDFSDTFAKYKALRADVAFFGCPPHDAVLINRGMRNADFNPLGFGFCSQTIDSKDYRNLGKHADYSFGCPSVGEGLSKIKGATDIIDRFYSEMGEKGKVVSKTNLITLAMIMGAIVNGLENAKSYDPVALRDAIAALDLNVGDRFIYWVDGMKFDKKGSNVKFKWIGGQLQNMQVKALFPDSVVSADDKPVWPMPKWRER